MIHAIIFDMDGVLIDSQPMHYLGDQQTLAAHSVEVPVEEMTAYAGTTNQLRFELFKERYHLDADVADMIREREATMIRLVRESDAVPTEGSVALLESIKADGLKTAVASSSSYPFIYAVLEKLGILSYFDLIFSGEDVKNGKPAPDIYRKACEEMGVKPEQAMAVEDSFNGIRSAHAAGLFTVMVPDQLLPTEEILTIVDKKCDSLTELQAQLPELLVVYGD